MLSNEVELFECMQSLAMPYQIFADDDTEAMDASNACIQLLEQTRQVTLHNCGTVCPALSHILVNTYCNNSQLFVDGQCILSKEGTSYTR